MEYTNDIKGTVTVGLFVTCNPHPKPLTPRSTKVNYSTIVDSVPGKLTVDCVDGHAAAAAWINTLCTITKQVQCSTDSAGKLGVVVVDAWHLLVVS